MFHVRSSWTRVVRVSVVGGVVRVKATVTRPPAAMSVVPEILGVRSFVTASSPPSIATAGGSVSMVRVWVKEPMLSAPSTTVATMVWSPFTSSAEANDQAPVADTVGFGATASPSTVTETVDGARTLVVPVIVGDAVVDDASSPPSMVTVGGDE